MFVTGGAPGDTVTVAIDEDRGSFSRAHVLEVVEAGPSRAVSPCPHAATCGGCPWSHLTYDAQLDAKRANVVANLERIGHRARTDAENLVEPIRGCATPWGYRNKLEFACGTDAAGRLTLGFHRADGDGIESIETCPLSHKAVARAPKALRGALRYLQGSGDLGIHRVGLRHSTRTGNCEVAIWTDPSSFPRKAVGKTIAEALRGASCVRVMAPAGKARDVRGVEVLAGAPRWAEKLHDIRFEVSAPSFFQVNTDQADVLIDLVCEGLQLTDTDTVADLYCGVGTFALPLAQHASSVFAVESAGSSVRDLRRIAEESDAWIDVIGGDSARELPQLGLLDAVVVDPPRAGLAKGVAESIAAARPRRIAYISCDSATWARDTERLATCGYDLVRATPVDLFPQTFHCEVVSIFEARDTVDAK